MNYTTVEGHPKERKLVLALVERAFPGNENPRHLSGPFEETAG
jgi:hypothetical protein